MARSGRAAFHEMGLTGVLLIPLKCVVRGVLFSLVVVVLCLTLDASCVWRASGLAPLYALRASTLAQGRAFEARQRVSPASVTAMANGLYTVLFEWTALQRMGQRFATPEALSLPDTLVRQFWMAHCEAFETAMVGIQLLGLRLAIVLRFLPLGALLYGVGTVDGLVQRAIRRAGGGRESAHLYHGAKSAQTVILGLVVPVLLGWPAPVRWDLCLGAIALTLGGLARLQWSFYRKHV